MNGFHSRAISLSLLLCGGALSAQISGNAGYQNGYAGPGGGNAHAEQIEHGAHVLSKEDLPPTPYSMYLDANVLMNVKADEYVAVFAISQEGATVDEAASKMDTTVKEFTGDLKSLHIRESDLFVDYIVQPKLYSYDVTNNTAREKLSGFELKKNISIHYTERDLIDKLVSLAAKEQIYDLVKVDYIIKDTAAVEDKLRGEAIALLKQKLGTYERLLGVKIEATPEIIADRSNIHYPTEMYDAYTAAEAEAVRPSNYDRYTIIQARKGRTFYFNPLDPSGFDKVINPIVLEPVVQFTLYLKVKYDTPHAAEAKSAAQ